MQLGSLSVDGATQEMLAILSGPFLMSWPTLEFGRARGGQRWKNITAYVMCSCE